MSNNTTQTTLDCDHNSLNTLDVSKNTALGFIQIYNNGIRGKAMTTFINRLCTVPTAMDEGVLCVKSNEITAKQVNMAKSKRWRVVIIVGAHYEDYEGLPEGDVNTDGSVGYKDVEALAKYIMGKLP